MIARLPYWVLTEKNPAFYDSESKTTVEMTAKVYAKIQELIDDYNKFVDDINKEIELFEGSINNEQNCFEDKITKVIHDYIDFLDSKVANQDKVINDTIIYIKNNISSVVTQIIGEMKENGEIDEAILNSFNNLELRVRAIETSLSQGYDETTETLSLNFYEISTDVNTLYVNNVTNYEIDEPNEQVNIEEEEGDM